LRPAVGFHRFRFPAEVIVSAVRWYLRYGVWRCVYRAVDQRGQVIDVLVSKRRDPEAARRFFLRALATLKVTPSEVVANVAPVCPRVLDELVPAGVAPTVEHSRTHASIRSWLMAA
jgi:transposase-like protein